LDGLVIYKYICLGNGQTVAEYASREKTFKHRRMDKPYSL
jgi:glutamate-5-semialdehyde dehydrogenase